MSQIVVLDSVTGYHARPATAIDVGSLHAAPHAGLGYPEVFRDLRKRRRVAIATASAQNSCANGFAMMLILPAATFVAIDIEVRSHPSLQQPLLTESITVAQPSQS
ncbi:MAG: hypothetical protein ACRCSX_12730, partial [Allorhizobium sp.]